LAIAASACPFHSPGVATIITLLLVGAVLLALETVLPGLIAGLVGFGCLVAGIVLAYGDFGPATGNLVLGIVVAGLVGGTLAWIKWLPNSRMARRFISSGRVGDLGLDRSNLIHRTGKAVTNLRPSGMAVIDKARVDVVTEGQLIEKGTPIQVIAVEGLRVIVRSQT
jgi:membrane-bound serine protease (ClpP class)